MSLLTSSLAGTARRRSAWPAIGLAVLLAVGLAVTTPAAFTAQNIINLLNQQSSVMSVTLGQTLVILSGGFDLSVGSVVSLTTAILSLGLPPVVGALLALVAAFGVGLANAVGIVQLRIHPILMTISTMTVVQGAALMIRPIPGGEVPDIFVRYANGTLLGLPLPIYAMVLLVLIASALVNRTRFGLHVYAVGGSAENAELGGVRSAKIIGACYVLCSLFACLGGINLAARIASGDPLVGVAFAIDSVAATALGGTLLSGGMGSIGGSVAGVAVLALLANGLNFWNVSSHFQMLIKGALLVAAVSAHRRSSPGL
jgi:ribose transport system permease protein